MDNLKYDNWLSDTNIGLNSPRVVLTVRVLLRVGCDPGLVDDRYLEREVIPDERKEEFMLVRPSVAFLIQQSPGILISKNRLTLDLSTIASALPPNLRTARYLYAPFYANFANRRFLAVNNNDDPTIAEGGSHWCFTSRPELMSGLY